MKGNIIMLRKCSKCGTIASTKEELTNFVKQARGKHGYRNLCKCCHSKSESYGARYDSDYYYDKSLKSRYGITFEEYNEMFNKQNGCCAICGTHQQNLKKKLYVDHDHATGNVRQLLCQHCNTLIGFAKDSTAILSEAISYINKHKE
jgi:hypothetical protein